MKNWKVAWFIDWADLRLERRRRSPSHRAMKVKANREKAYRRRVDQARLAYRTILLHKPFGVLPCFTDSEGRPTLSDYVDLPGVYPAGRLDFDSEGLMVLTSDGALAHVITDPAYKCPKIYWVQIERDPDETALERLQGGVLLRGQLTKPATVCRLDGEPSFPERTVPIRFRKTVPTCWLEITLREGQNRQVRRMTAAVGHPTLRLIRVAVGHLRLDGLKPGEWRDASSEEVNRFWTVNRISTNQRGESPKTYT